MATNLRALVCATLGFVVLAVACGGESSKATPAPTATHTVAPSLQTPLPPGVDTPTPTPEYTGGLRTGVWVRVEGSGDCLNFRAGPATANSEGQPPVNSCQPDGFVGYILAGPLFGEGHWWWGIAGQGWAVEDFLVFQNSEDLNNKVVPQLAGLGKIAFWDMNSGIWVMDSDRSDRRKLVDTRSSVDDLRWAPDGQRLSFSASSRTEEGGTQDVVRVIDLEGRQQLEIPQATSAFWSPDGASLAFLGSVSHVETTLEGVPTVMDLATGETRAIGERSWFSEGPRWRPDGKMLVFSDGSGIHLVAPDGSGHRLIAGALRNAGSWPVNWSPSGTMLSLYYRERDQPEKYIVYDITQDQVVAAIELYPGGFDHNRCARAAVSEDYQTDWTPDGATLIFHTECGVAGENGVWVVDVATGERRLIPVWSAWFVDPAPDGRHLVFMAGGGTRQNWAGTIWVADVDGSPPVLLAEGWMPVWQPQPR